MNRILFALSFFLISFYAHNQSFSWLNSVELDYEYNPGMIKYTTCSDEQGGAYFFGIQEHVTFYNESMGSLFLKRYSAQGEIMWSRTIEGQSLAAGINCLGQDVFVYGQMYAEMDFWGEDTLVKSGIGTDAYLARISGNGDLLWALNLTGLPAGEGTVSNLDFDVQGNIYVAYSTWINSYILIFNGEGELLQMVIQEDVSVISGIDVDNDGNIYVAGSCAGWNSIFNGVSYPAPFSYTTYLVRYNTDYQPEWVKYIEDFTCTFPMVKVNDAGLVYFAGSLLAETDFDTITVHGPAWAYDFFLAALNPDGNYLWVNECPEVITGDASVGSLHYLDIDPEGNAILSGITRGVIDWGNGIQSDVSGNSQDIIIWSYNESGHLKWVKTAGGAGYDLSHSVSAGEDGSVFLAGVINGTAQFDTITVTVTGSVDPFLAKLDNGVISNVEDDRIAISDVRVFPNPASEFISIYSNPGYDFYELINNTGVVEKAGVLSSSQCLFDIHGLPPGLYVLKIRSGVYPDQMIKVLIR